MLADPFDEEEFFRAIAASGARALLIGRGAIIALGYNLMTTDYDFWVHPDDAQRFNAALAPLDFIPNRSPEEARQRDRYVLEQDEKVDVLIARNMPTIDGRRVAIDDLWARRQEISYAPGSSVPIRLPNIPDLILTKLFGSRPKDAEDIRLLTALAGDEREKP